MSTVRRTLHYAGRTEFARYFWAGCLAFLTDFTVLLLLTEGAGINYLWSNLAAVSAGMVASYLLCVKWVFVARRYHQVTTEFSVFVLVSLCGLALNEALLWVSVEFFGFHYLVAKVIVTLAIFVVNFCLKKKIIFS